MTNVVKKQRLWPEVRTTFQVTMAEKGPFLQRRDFNLNPKMIVRNLGTKLMEE